MYVLKTLTNYTQRNSKAITLPVLKVAWPGLKG